MDVDESDRVMCVSVRRLLVRMYELMDAAVVGRNVAVGLAVTMSKREGNG